jgi:tRNA pseudouridine55 synthase
MTTKTQHPLVHNIILVNKETGWTSTDVVSKMKCIIDFPKIGHAGTLDPLADGLLILATGTHTKLIPEIQKSPKEYIFTGILGAWSKSYDAEFAPELRKPITTTLQELQTSVNKHLIGEIQQTPPPFSAIKIQGKRAYKLARKDISCEMPSRTINIAEIECLGLKRPMKTELPDTFNQLQDFSQLYLLKARVVCSSGTYIRSLIDDIGRLYGSNGMLIGLTRTKIGDYRLEDALTLAQIESNS